MRRAALIALPLMLSACSGQSPDNGAQPAGNAAAAATAPAKSADQAFVDTAAASESFAMTAANLARAKAEHPELKALAGALFDAHVAAGDALRAAAAKVPDLVPSPVLPPALMTAVNGLQVSEGATFDQVFLEQQRRLEARQLEEMEDYAANGATAPLKSYASENIQRIRARIALLDRYTAR